MSDLAKAGVTQIVDLADNAIDAAITALESTGKVAVATGQAVVNVGGRTLDAALDELRILKSQLREALLETTDAVVDAVHAP